MFRVISTLPFTSSLCLYCMHTAQLTTFMAGELCSAMCPLQSGGLVNIYSNSFIKYLLQSVLHFIEVQQYTCIYIADQAVYCIHLNFRGAQFSQIDNFKSFLETSFCRFFIVGCTPRQCLKNFASICKATNWTYIRQYNSMARIFTGPTQSSTMSFSLLLWCDINIIKSGQFYSFSHLEPSKQANRGCHWMQGKVSLERDPLSEGEIIHPYQRRASPL